MTAFHPKQTSRLVSGWRRREDGKARLSRSAERAFKPMLEPPQILRSAQLHDVEAAHRPRVATAGALDPERRLEADEIGSRADMLGGHDRSLTHEEHNRNTGACGKRGRSFPSELQRL